VQAQELAESPAASGARRAVWKHLAYPLRVDPDLEGTESLSVRDLDLFRLMTAAQKGKGTILRQAAASYVA
jgi:hypothetical protein